MYFFSKSHQFWLRSPPLTSCSICQLYGAIMHSMISFLQKMKLFTVVHSICCGLLCTNIVWCLITVFSPFLLMHMPLMYYLIKNLHVISTKKNKQGPILCIQLVSKNLCTSLILIIVILFVKKQSIWTVGSPLTSYFIGWP